MLRNLNKKFAKLNLLNSKSIHDIKFFGSRPKSYGKIGIIDYLTPREIKLAETWPGEHFDYRINTNGFRGKELPIEADIGAFGCSFTFGTGLAESMLWHDLLSKELNQSIVNFGMPARSVQSVVEIFLIVTKHIKIKKAVFLLPAISRLQLAKADPESMNIFHLDIIPNQKTEFHKKMEVDDDSLFRAIPNEEMQKICKNQIYLLEYIAKERNIDIYLSSWSEDTYEVLENLELTTATLLPDWNSKGLERGSDLARDGFHPGPLHHIKWMNEIKEYIKCTT
jgi:hypothetical protein